MKFPNAVFIFYDYSLNSQNSYPFQCFRFAKNFLSNLDKLDLEEDIKKQTKSFSSDEILQNLAFTIQENEYSVFSSLAYSENYRSNGVDNYIDLEERKMFNEFKSPIEKKIHTRLTEVNRLSEAFIEEQKKYINYFKVKRQFGKTKESEFLEMLNKKGSELANLDKFDITIAAKNINNIKDRIKASIDQINLRNAFEIEKY